MRNPCEKMRERIAHLISGMLSEIEMQALNNHMSDCLACREYAEALRREDGLLEEFAGGLESGMDSRIGRVIEAVDDTEMDGAGILTLLRSVMGSSAARWAVAALLIVGLLTSVIIMQQGGDEVVAPVADRSRIEKPVVADDAAIDEVAVEEKRLAKALMAELRLVDDLYANADVDGLVEMLADGQWDSRVAAANYLAKIGDQRALMPLVKMVEQWPGDGENPFIEAAKDIVVRMDAGIDELAANDSAESVETVSKVDKRADPASIESLHVIEGALDGEIFTAQRHHWFRKPHYYRMEQGDNITIDNGINAIVLDKKAKTAQMRKSGDRDQGVSFEYVKSVVSSVQNGDLSGLYGHRVESEAEGCKVEIPEVDMTLLADKSDDEILVYQVKIENSEEHLTLMVDAKTMLLDRTLAGSEPGRGEQWRFYYDEIPLENFSLVVPAGFEKLLPPKFAGRVVDADGMGLAGFDIYVVGSPWGSEKGTSGSDGGFEFEIPMKGHGHKGPMRYPLFVRAVSNEHPGWVGWTIILDPDDKRGDLSGWVSEQAGIEAAVDSSRNCTGIWGVELVVEPAGQISGIVVDRHDRPIAGATVKAKASVSGQSFYYPWLSLSDDGHKDRYIVKTDIEGRYSITGVPTFAWIGFEDGLSEKEIAKRKQRRHVNIDVSTEAKGYVSKGKGLEVKDEFSSQSVDFVLSGADVTVTGRVINERGEPITDRIIYYGEGNSFRSQDWRTDKDGSFKLSNAPASDNLRIRVGSNKPLNWDKSKATKGKEYKYYMDKDIDLGFEEGTYEYDLGDIVLDEPDLTIEFEVKDTSDQPIEGLEVSFRNYSMDHYWQQQFRVRTDVNGKCVFEKCPDVERSWFSVKWHFTGEAKDDQEQQQREYLKQFNAVTDHVELPGDERGYFIEVTVPRLDERSFKGDKIRIYGSDGQLVWPVKR